MQVSKHIKEITTMKNNEKLLEEIQQIRSEYAAAEPDKLEQLRKLDSRIKRPSQIFAYSFGTAGSLVLGTGMCLALGTIGASLASPIGMVLGVCVGVVGIAMVSLNYLFYKLILKRSKDKYGKQILDLSDEILNETKE